MWKSFETFTYSVFTNCFLFDELVWEIQEVRNIQRWVFIFLIPFYELHKLSFYYGVMVFTCKNHLQLARISVSSLLNSFFMSWYGKNKRFPRIQQWLYNILIPFHVLQKLCLYYRVMVFTCDNHLQLARIFFFATWFFFHKLVWEIQDVRKIQQWIINFLIPFHELHELCLY